MKAGSYAHHPGHHGDHDHGNNASHDEHHSNNGSLIRDITIGFADGLTVPFALTAGLSSLGSTKIVVIGGLAELFSGMISMGLGAYLAAATERQHWQAEYARECWEVDHCKLRSVTTRKITPISSESTCLPEPHRPREGAGGDLRGP